MHRVLLATVVMLALAAPAAAVTEEQFRLRSGADLVAVCSTPTEDPLYVAAVHFCHGFGAGTFQTIQAMTTHEKLEPVLCPPNPLPTRNEGIRRFLDWAKSHQDEAQEPAVHYLGRFLLAQWPCPK
jgi:Rap1a immunity proteins